MDNFRDAYERSYRVFADLTGDYTVQNVYFDENGNGEDQMGRATIMRVPGARNVPLIQIWWDEQGKDTEDQGHNLLYLALINGGSWVVAECHLLAPQEISGFLQWVEMLNVTRGTGQAQALTSALQNPPAEVQVFACWHLGIQRARYVGDDFGEFSMLATSPPGFGRLGISRIIRSNNNILVLRFQSDDGQSGWQQTLRLRRGAFDP